MAAGRNSPQPQIFIIAFYLTPNRNYDIFFMVDNNVQFVKFMSCEKTNSTFTISFCEEIARCLTTR